MARTKKLAAATEARDQPATAAQLVTRASPLVFVSHDTRDADLAEAFDNLLTDASGGVVKTFRSSDRKGQAGIEYGAEWFPAIMAKLNDATDVVALLTPSSIDRPWILYEAGVARVNSTRRCSALRSEYLFPRQASAPSRNFKTARMTRSP